MINTKLSLLLYLASGVVSPTSARFGGWGGGHGGGGHGGGGKGGGHGGEGMGGHGGMSKRDMMDLIHNMIDNRALIVRDKENTENGILSYTYSNDEEVGSWIQQHVSQMMSLMNSDNGSIRGWDDLFAELFDNRDKHEIINVVNVNEDGSVGVRLEQVVSDEGSGDETCIKALIQEHANVVSNFVSRGRDEMHDNHPVPQECQI